MNQLHITCPYCSVDSSQYGTDDITLGYTTGIKTIHATVECPDCNKEIYLYFELTRVEKDSD